MEQPQTDQPAPQPKKHRMTYAEWKQSHPTITPEDEKAIEEIGECCRMIVESFGKWVRECQAEVRRKERLARARNPTTSAPATRRRSRVRKT